MPTEISLPDTEVACARLEALTVKLNAACAACQRLVDLLGALDAKLASFDNDNLQKLKGVANANCKHD